MELKEERNESDFDVAYYISTKSLRVHDKREKTVYHIPKQCLLNRLGFTIKAVTYTD